jgi:hypothetical protein
VALLVGLAGCRWFNRGEPSLKLTVSVEGNGSVGVEPDEPLYVPNTRVSLTARPGPGWRLDRWEGDVAGTSGEVAFRIQSEATVTAVFVPAGSYGDRDVLQTHAGAPEGPTIIFIGDGYTAADLAGGEYARVGADSIELMLETAPISYYRKSFNAYIVFAESGERGSDSSPAVDERDTIFDTTFGYSGIDRLLVPQNVQECLRYCALAVADPEAIDIVLLSVNDDRYGGSGGLIATFSRNELSAQIAVHEIGHSFGGLADEYVDEQLQQYFPLSQLGDYPNVDDTGDPKLVKWARFIGRDGYEAVGTFEGGYYRAAGVWRPEAESIMSSIESPSYNAPSREAIAGVIFGILDLPFDFEEFAATDIAQLPLSRRGAVAPVGAEALLMPVPTELYAPELYAGHSIGRR